MGLLVHTLSGILVSGCLIEIIRISFTCALLLCALLFLDNTGVSDKCSAMF